MLHFRILGIPVGVHATFLFVALLGAGRYRGIDIAVWTAAAFLAILFHELGHALTARAFGAQGVNVSLYGLGGLTSYRHGGTISNGQSFLISAAGSAVGIAAGGAVWLLEANGWFSSVGPHIDVFIDSFIYTALVWGVLNWIPIVPLDGGHMMESLVAMVNPGKAPLIGQIITWITVAIVVPVAWLNGYQFAVFILIMFAFSGLREYRNSMAAERRRQAGPMPAPPAAPTPDESPPEFPI